MLDGILAARLLLVDFLLFGSLAAKMPSGKGIGKLSDYPIFPYRGNVIVL